jgi:hypothetical protein
MDKSMHPLSTAAKPGNMATKSKTGLSAAQAMDEFESALILAYEQALKNGVSPYEALAVMLGLASTETLRLSEAEIAAPDR